MLTPMDSEYVLYAVVLYVSYLAFEWIRRKVMDWKSLPPGPSSLPIVGYLPWVDSKTPHLTFDELANKYGDIYSVQLGSINVVVLSDPLTIKKVFSMKETTKRPPLYVTHGIMEGYGIISSDGKSWNEHRRFLLNFMRNQGMRSNSFKDQMEERVRGVALELVEEIDSEHPMDIIPVLINSLGNCLNELAFGFKYPKDDKTWIWLQYLLQEGIKLVGIGGPMNFLPWLRFVPKYNNILKFLKDNQILSHQKYQEIIDRTEVEMQEKTELTAEESETCLTKAYLKEMNNSNTTYNFLSYKQLHHLAADIFGAGTETTATTLIWYLLDLAIHPDIQNELRKELLRLSNGSNVISMEDIESYNYFEATMKESQRLRTILALGIPHGVTEDIQIDGYCIPKGSMLLPFQWRIHHSTKYWDQPMKYIPQRFMDDQGNLKKFDAFMPFQIGRRQCPGDEFAKMVILMFTATILLTYQVVIDESMGNKPDEDPICGLTMAPRPFKLKFQPLVS